MRQETSEDRGSRIADSGNGASWSRESILQGGLYTLIGALTPVSNVLASDATLTSRAIVSLVISSIIAGAIALKAYLSNSKRAGTEEKETPAPSAPPWSV